MTTEVTVESDQLLDLMSFSATFTVIEDAVQNLDAVQFDDDGIAALTVLPEDARMKVLARLIELAEQQREALRALDFAIVQIQGQDQ